MTSVSKPTKQPDPLYIIFEQHLYNFQDADIDRKTFILAVIQDYLSYLRKMNMSVPKSLESAIIDELASQVTAMLVKKIYGCLTLSEYKNGITPKDKKAAKSRYTKLAG
jgi:hypothetical protein